MDLKEIGFENEKWIELAGCGIEWYCTVLHCLLGLPVSSSSSILRRVPSVKLRVCYCLNNSTRQAMYVIRNIESRSRNRFCHGKAIITTYTERVCGLSYPACNALAPYCHLWHVWLYHVFPRCLVNGTIFGKKGRGLLNVKCVF